MDNLKMFIDENKEQFSEELLPNGDTERFLSKMKRGDIHFGRVVKKRPVSFIRIVAFPIAAVAVLMLIMNIFVKGLGEEDETKRIYTDYCREVAQISTEIQMMTNENNISVADRTIDNITFEAIPFIEQLPPEMTPKQRAKAVKEYYSQKLDGVKRLKTLVADSAAD